MNKISCGVAHVEGDDHAGSIIGGQLDGCAKQSVAVGVGRYETRTCKREEEIYIGER